MNLFTTDAIGKITSAISDANLDSLPLEDRIDAINQIRLILHRHSPFASEPVDCVQWVPVELVFANDYNPNAVAPPEMKLLEHSIMEDGYTQPIVAWKHDGRYEVIDGFHRNRVGRESKKVRDRVHSFLPLATINSEREDRNDRIASTIRHNRARGKHKVEAMSDIVIELKRRNWSDDKIGRELGMDSDEVLRLCQITGLAEVFADQEFSKSWDIDSSVGISEELDDTAMAEPKMTTGRILHTWEKWECFRHGFYEDHCPNGMSQAEGEEQYRQFLADLSRFESSLQIITTEWKFSCEHYLTNDRMNRIAWLGQAAVAHALQIPSCCRGGYNLLDESQREAADELALTYLNKWLIANGREPIEKDAALSRTEAEMY